MPDRDEGLISAAGKKPSMPSHREGAAGPKHGARGWGSTRTVRPADLEHL